MARKPLPKPSQEAKSIASLPTQPIPANDLPDPDMRKSNNRQGRQVVTSLKERVQAGSANFDFDTLLQGVSTLSDSHPDPVGDAEHSPVSQREEPTNVPTDPAPVEHLSSYPRPLHKASFTGPMAEYGNRYRSRRLFLWIFAIAGISCMLMAGVIARQQMASLFGKTPNAALAHGLPDPHLTPGEIRKNASSPGPVSDSVRQEVFRAYGLKPGDSHYVVSYLIPGSLGGTNNTKNLFPQTPAFANWKHRLDGYLESKVHSHKLTAKQAQSELTSNWIKAAQNHHIHEDSNTKPQPSRKKDDSLHR